MESVFESVLYGLGKVKSTRNGENIGIKDVDGTTHQRRLPSLPLSPQRATALGHDRASMWWRRCDGAKRSSELKLDETPSSLVGSPGELAGSGCLEWGSRGCQDVIKCDTLHVRNTSPK